MAEADQETSGKQEVGVCSPGTLGVPRQRQLVRGEVRIEEGKAIQDALGQALSRGVLLPPGSTGL